MPWRLLLQALPISLLLTLAFELFYSRLWGLREKRDVLLVILVNVLTNPVVVFVVYYVRIRRLPVNYGIVTVVMEAFAVITEALIYQKYARTIDRPWLFSLSANAFSFAVGELINGIR